MVGAGLSRRKGGTAPGRVGAAMVVVREVAQAAGELVG